MLLQPLIHQTDHVKVIVKGHELVSGLSSKVLHSKLLILKGNGEFHIEPVWDIAQLKYREIIPPLELSFSTVILHDSGVIRFVPTHFHISALFLASSMRFMILVASMFTRCFWESLEKFILDIQRAKIPTIVITTSISARVKAANGCFFLIKVLSKNKKNLIYEYITLKKSEYKIYYFLILSLWRCY